MTRASQHAPKRLLGGCERLTHLPRKTSLLHTNCTFSHTAARFFAKSLQVQLQKMAESAASA